ncbi:sortase-associated OmpA-like protein PdsO [Shewanella sp. GXUN23E]|uniref:sortase-associated OmpA-like protein PdsO n=1 Tax=Shewanella sp. GXUN23E TaxID=3422498 RepID=UPI003D7DD0BC
MTSFNQGQPSNHKSVHFTGRRAAALLLSGLLLSQSAHASQMQEREHTQELIGVGSGLVLGAVVGGPVGAFIGALTGGLIGQSVGDEEEIKYQQMQLALSQTELQTLSAQHQQLQQDAERLAEQSERRIQAQLDALALGLNVQFRTGSSEIEPHFRQQLDDVAHAMRLSPELTLDLTGYADRQGNTDYNQALSEQRLAEVRSYLIEQGVNAGRLHGRAYGDQSPLHAEASLENNFFDRRVTLKLQGTGDAMTAAQ